jgi:glyoxalase family protein
MPLHHVTAMAGDPVRHLDFYTRILGLRLVKKTVNFDDPGTYHLYYGDDEGRPGTVLTFFPWPHAAPHRKGMGEAVEVAFSILSGALSFWQNHLAEQGIGPLSFAKRFGQSCLIFSDPDDLNLALVESEGTFKRPFWPLDPFTAATAIRGFHSVTLIVPDVEKTGLILSEVFGLKRDADEEGRLRFYHQDACVDLLSSHQQGRIGRGSVHHIAFRAKDDEEQALMVRKLHDLGIMVTEQKDRQYFRSVYFREPGGVLFEIATDSPGFMVDEPFDALGSSLMLPPFLEARRAEIEAALPAL